MATDGLNGKFVPGSSRASLVEKLSTLLLLFILLAAAVAGIASVLTSQDWGSLLRAALFGMVLGWGLALFRQPAWRAAWITVAFGLIYVFLFPGGLAGKAVDVLVEAVRLIPSSLAFFRGETIELDSLKPLLQEFSASAGIIAQRLQTWMTALVNGQPVFDPVAAALVWSMFVWMVAAWAGWILEAQRNVLLAALPVVLLSVGTLAYGRRTSFVLYLMMGSLLLLLALVQQGQREQLWEETGVAYPARKGRQVIRAASLATIGLVLFSAFASSLSLHRLQEWISDHTKSAAQRDNGNLGESLGILSSSTGAPDLFETVRSPGLPRDHLIGSGPELSQRTVMTVAVKDLPSLSSGGQPLPLYWRSLTYDTYTRNGWQTSKTEPESYDAGQPLQEKRARDHISIQQDFSPVEDLGGTVYAAGEPMMVNRPTEAAWRSSGDLFGVQIEQSVSYQALSLIPVVDERSLRAAGQEYPEWIRRRYLALPADLPDRVKSLAIELTASEPTPYDRAKAIEHYLRGFPYTLDVSRPPLNRDVVDYFLFDLKKGYCDYYATAMVVLARAAGVPARLAIGYASGTYNLNSKRFIVTEADGHSWVEVYFPDIGWVPFEPTASRPPLEREKAAPAVQPAEPPSPPAPQGRTILPGWRWLLGGAGSVILLGAFWVLFDEIRLRRLSKQAVAVEVYKRLRRYGNALGMNSNASDTPFEFVAFLTVHLQGLIDGSFKPAFTAQLLQDLRRMVADIVQTLYRPSSPESLPDTGILKQWMSLRGKLQVIRIFMYRKTYSDSIRRKWEMTFAQEK